MKRCSIIAVLAVTCMTQVQASSIGFVDMEKIFQEFYKTVKEEIMLQRQMDIFKQYAVGLEKEIDERQRNANKLRDESLNLIYSETVRKEKREGAQKAFLELQDKRRELRDYQNEKKRDLRQEYEKTREQLVAEIKDVVQQEARNRKLQIVLDSSGKTLNGIPAFVYYEPEMDFTDAVVEILNRGHHAELEELRRQSRELDNRARLGDGVGE